jgi:NADH:ubiquinone oxidoreductase subunit D
MAYLAEHIAHYCEFRRQVLADLSEYTSGRRRTSDLSRGVWRDTTADTVAELKRRVASLNKTIAVWEAMKNTKRP